ncbi:MAG: sulfotransferase domain-containing protein, partial [Candidatus Hodarchaeota archaeon]
MESKNIKPNFIIAGTARSGTTTLYSYLKQHPEICMSSIKEPEFFSRYYNKGIEWYLRFFFKLNKQSSKKIFLYALLPRFKRCRNEKFVGEATTRYFHYPKAVERIYKFNPHFKLIFILRNPITRAFSNYVREIQTKGIRERFEKIIKTNHIRRKEYLNPGRYFTHLSRFLKYFSKKQIHIIIFEKFLSNPNKILKNVLSFLGANNTFNFNHNIIKSNPSVMPISLFFQKIIDRFF